MRRCPEPELMNEPDQVIAYSNADFSSGDDLVIERLSDLIDQSSTILSESSLILDLGCGPGNISERLAARWPLSSVIGFDGAPTMIDIANQRLHGLRPAITNLTYLLFDLSHNSHDKISQVNNASVIVSNSLLHHLHEPQVLWALVKNLAGPATFMLHRDLRRPSNEQAVTALCDRYVSNAPSVLQRDFRASLNAAFTADEVRDQLDDAGLGQFTVMEIGDRYLEVFGQF